MGYKCVRVFCVFNNFDAFPNLLDTFYLSDRKFSPNAIILPQHELRRRREVKARCHHYVPLSGYTHLAYSSKPVSVLSDTILLRPTPTRLCRYASFLTPQERKSNPPLYDPNDIVVPIALLAFMDFWNRYLSRLKAEHDALALTLVALRHFKGQYVEV